MEFFNTFLDNVIVIGFFTLYGVVCVIGDIVFMTKITYSKLKCRIKSIVSGDKS